VPCSEVLAAVVVATIFRRNRRAAVC